MTNVHPRRAEFHKPPVQMVEFVTAYCSRELQRTSDKVNLSFKIVKNTHTHMQISEVYQAYAWRNLL